MFERVLRTYVYERARVRRRVRDISVFALKPMFAWPKGGCLLSAITSP